LTQSLELSEGALAASGAAQPEAEWKNKSAPDMNSRISLIQVFFFIVPP
jgi:hypothetical protein